MASRLRPLRVLLPVGVISGCVVASKSSASPSRCDEQPEDTVSGRLARQLEGAENNVDVAAVVLIAITDHPHGGMLEGRGASGVISLWKPSFP